MLLAIVGDVLRFHGYKYSYSGKQLTWQMMTDLKSYTCVCSVTFDGTGALDDFTFPNMVESALLVNEVMGWRAKNRWAKCKSCAQAISAAQQRKIVKISPLSTTRA